MGYLDRDLPQAWVLHPISALRKYAMREFTDHGLAAMREIVVKDRAEYFRALAANDDADLPREEYAEAYDSYIRALDWALTLINREQEKRRQAARRFPLRA